jgi:hypothetical protein
MYITKEREGLQPRKELWSTNNEADITDKYEDVYKSREFYKVRLFLIYFSLGRQT